MKQRNCRERKAQKEKKRAKHEKERIKMENLKVKLEGQTQPSPSPMKSETVSVKLVNFNHLLKNIFYFSKSVQKNLCPKL